MNPPEWLTKREGSLHTGLNPQTWLVTFNGHQLYRLFATTAKGQFTCAVTQTNNGKRLDAGKNYPSIEGALTGGLEELRERLGW
ncbi:MAG: hypothetical protein K8T89_11640 [Planctomycetes bacterium]|nr:hypothetical protein [Planctomycetota bacterium]